IEISGLVNGASREKEAANAAEVREHANKTKALLFRPICAAPATFLFILRLFYRIRIRPVNGLLFKNEAPLWQRGSGFAFHQPNVGAVEESIGIDVLAEIGPIDGVSGLCLGLANIAGIDEAIGIGIADQKIDRDPNVAGR